MASSIQGENNSEDLKKFALEHARAGWAFAIPPLTFLFILGDVVLKIWMGPDYSIWLVTALLSAGYLLPISQSTVLRVLVGLDAHGRVAGTGLLISAGAMAIGLTFASAFGWSLPLAAAVIAGAAGFGAGLNVLIHAVQYLNVGARTYYRAVGQEAVVLLVATAAPLWGIRLVTDGHALLTVGLGLLSTVITFAFVRRSDLRKIVGAFGERRI